MKRREFIVLLTGSAAWAPATAEQSTSIRRIGMLSPFSRANTARWEKALLLGLRDAGWIDGRNLVIERRYAEGRLEQLPDLAGDLVRQKSEIIVTTVTADTQAAKNAADIPVVMVAVGDPVATGIVTSLARPGGHVTGLSQMTPDLSGKRLELLKEIVPNVSTIGLLFNQEDPLSVIDWKEAQRSAQTLGITNVHSFEVSKASDLDKALNEATSLGAEALAMMPAPVLIENLKQVADFAIRNRIPSTFHLREYAEAGGLVSYGVDRADLFRRAASYIDKILKGANPADLPIEQPTKFELVINLKTARELSIAIPPRVLGMADEVIE